MTDSRRRALIVAACGVAFLLLVVGALFAGIAAGKSSANGSTPGGGSSTAPTRAVPSDQGSPSPIPTCSINSIASVAALKSFSGSVVNVSSGTTVFDRHGADAATPAGGQKVLTAAAAITALGANFRITTKVVDGATPGSITLIGQGDATLSRNPAGQTVYTGAATLAALAAATKTAYDAAHPGVPLTNVTLDSSYWDPADNWESSWPRNLQTGGLLSEVTALQVDGDRTDPQQQVSPRSTDPVAAAGQAFVTALGIPNVTTTLGTAENGAPDLAQVQSQPLSTLVKQMLLTNDDTLAEMLARIVSVKENMGGGSTSIQAAIEQALNGVGPDASDLVLADGSGESNQDVVPATYLATLLGTIYKGSNSMKYVQAGLPLAGKTGNLVGRFVGTNAVAAGHVSAAPGALAGQAYTLSGNVKAKDGTALSFALYAERSGITISAQAALDTLATAIYRCGANLADL